MKRDLSIALLYTLVTAVLLGLAYPLALAGLAHLMFPVQADGTMLSRDHQIAGSRLIGQPFTGASYFHSRPSAAGAGYDAAASSGSNLAPTSRALVARVARGVSAEQQGGAVPVDLVTASASGLDPDLSPAAAAYQVARVAAARGMEERVVRRMVQDHTVPRQLGLLGEPRVNVLELNLALDAAAPRRGPVSRNALEDAARPDGRAASSRMP